MLHLATASAAPPSRFASGRVLIASAAPRRSDATKTPRHGSTFNAPSSSSSTKRNSASTRRHAPPLARQKSTLERAQGMTRTVSKFVGRSFSRIRGSPETEGQETRAQRLWGVVRRVRGPSPSPSVRRPPRQPPHSAAPPLQAHSDPLTLMASWNIPGGAGRFRTWRCWVCVRSAPHLHRPPRQHDPGSNQARRDFHPCAELTSGHCSAP